MYPVGNYIDRDDVGQINSTKSKKKQKVKGRPIKRRVIK